MRAGASVTTGSRWAAVKRSRRRFFAYRKEATRSEQAALALGFAALTGLAAQIYIPLPFSPVPITLQTFAVLVTGVALGARLGGASQALYVGIGAAGVPWFTGATAGLGTIFGPTGGYIVGFVVAAVVVGFVTDRVVTSRGLLGLTVLLGAVNFVVIYGIALPWLFGWLTLTSGGTATIADVLTVGLLPYIPGDVVKVIGAAFIGTAILPATAVDPAEFDAE